MNQFQAGYKEAVGGVVTALVINIIVPKFIESGLLPSSWGLFILVLNLLATVIFVLMLPSATLWYFAGWIFGMYIMFQAGLLDIWDILTFIASVALYIYVNFFSHRNE